MKENYNHHHLFFEFNFDIKAFASIAFLITFFGARALTGAFCALMGILAADEDVAGVGFAEIGNVSGNEGGSGTTVTGVVGGEGDI